jgi:hypothetical protein
LALRIKKARAQAPGDELPTRLPGIKLHHGSAMWVLTQLGFRGAVSESTFKEYIKSLRKLGIPFSRDDTGNARRGQSKQYSYAHLMELALVLFLRVYHVVPDSVVVKIIRYRKNLYLHYERAFMERRTGRGAPIVVESGGHVAFRLCGVFLDLQMDFSGGKLVRFGPPRLLSPHKALAMYAGSQFGSESISSAESVGPGRASDCTFTSCAVDPPRSSARLSEQTKKAAGLTELYRRTRRG